MIQALKSRLISKLLRSTQLKYPEKHNLTDIQRCLEETTRFCRVKRNTLCEGKVLQLRTGFLKHTPLKDIDFLQAVTSSDGILKPHFSDVIYIFEAQHVLAEAVLTDIHKEGENYGINHAREYNQHFNGRSFVNVPKNENIVIDYCSPTIAKPFHEGHLRSAVIGNFVKNISKLFNKNVTSINYLGDWGSHMGLLVTGYEKHALWHEHEENLKGYLDYVYELISEDDRVDRTETYKAIKFMNSLELGDPKALDIWQKIRNIRVNEYNEMYQRLGFEFDVTAAESQYVLKAAEVISMLKEKNLLKTNRKTGMRFVDVTEDGDKINLRANILKKDGHKTIYLTRDVASTLDRFNTYSADRYIYVMDDSEQKYFTKLQRVVKKLAIPDQSGRMEFVMFGRNIVESKQIMPSLEMKLDVAQLYIKNIMNGKCTKVKAGMIEDVSNHYAVSKFIELSLSQRKNKPFNVEIYNTIGKGRLGLSMQFSHAKLCSLIEKFDTDYSFSSIDFRLLSEDIAIRLIQHLARYHEVLIQSYVELEACHLVHYLKDLVRLETLAYEELCVLNQPVEIAKARFALFKCVKQVLANGMKILGMTPLESI